MPTYDINIATPGLDRARAQFQQFGRVVGGASRALTDIVTATASLAAGYLTLRRGVQQASLAVAGLPAVFKIATTAAVAATVAYNRWLNEMERTGREIRELNEQARELGLTSVEFLLLADAAKTTGDSLEDMAESMGTLTEAQQLAIEEARRHTILLSAGYAAAATAYTQSAERLDEATDRIGTEMFGLSETFLEAQTAINNFITRGLVRLDRNVRGIAEVAASPIASLTMLIDRIRGTGTTAVTASPQVQEFNDAAAEAARSTGGWAEALSEADRQMRIVIQQQTALAALQDQAFGGTGNAQVEGARLALRAEEERLAVFNRITTAARLENQYRGNVRSLLDEATARLQEYLRGNEQSATVIRNMTANVAALRAEWEALNAPAEIEEVMFELNAQQEAYLRAWQSTVGAIQQARLDIEGLNMVAATIATQIAAITQDGIIDPEEAVKLRELQEQLAQVARVRLRFENPPEEEVNRFQETLALYAQFGLTQGIQRALEGDFGGALSAFADIFSQGISQAVSGAIADAIQNSAFGQGLSNFFGGLFGGGRQFGGLVDANRAYTVGERGPELFIPEGRGRIVPNNELQRGGGQVTNNITVVGGGDSQAEREALAQAVALATEQRINQRRHDGRF